MNLEIVPAEEPGRLRLSGELDLATADRLRETLGSAPAPDGALVLDLAELRFIDSSGVRVLLNACRDLRERGGELVLESPRGAVRDVLELLELHRHGVTIRGGMEP